MTKMAKVGTTFLATVRLKYVNIFKDRHGKPRAYYRHNGRSVPLKGEPGSPEFMEAYKAELKKDEKHQAPGGSRSKSKKRTIDALTDIYFNSPEYLRLKPGTQKAYKSSLKGFLDAHGHRSVAKLEYAHLSKIIGQMKDRPAAANNLLKRLRQMFTLAKRMNWISVDPSEGIGTFRLKERRAWGPEEHVQFIKHWAPGSMPRLAYMAHFHTGQRRGDIVRLPRPKSKGEPFRITQEKTGVKLVIDVAEPLWDEIERHEKRMMLLVTSFGKPFTSNGYGNWFRERCREAGLPEWCTSNGLRKAAAKDLAEAGCTTKEIQSIGGWVSLKEVERYTREAEQESLAKSAMAKRSRNSKLQTD